MRSVHAGDAAGMNLHKRYPVLSDRQCGIMHEASCRLLEQVGIDVAHDGARKLFLEAGAVERNGRIHIGRELVDAAVEKTARTIQLGARDPNSAITLDPAGKPAVHFGTGGQALNVLHWEDGAFAKRPAVTEDLIRILRLAQQLPHVDFITRPVEPDVAEEEMDTTKARLFSENTTKHMNLANLVCVDNLPRIVETVGDPSLISFISCLMVSPLHMVGDTTEKFMRIVRHDIPVAISSCAQAGTTAPLSEVGEVVQVNAEVLSAVVLGNLIRPGARLLHRGLPITADLYSDGSPRWCQPDSIRRCAMMTDMTYYYGIPCCGTAGVSDEPLPSARAVAEKALALARITASGAQFVNSALGMLERIVTVCPEQYVIDDTILSCVKNRFASPGDEEEVADLCRMSVEDSLAALGVDPAPAGKEIAARIDYVLGEREEISTDAMEGRIASIEKAVASSQSSTAFMRDARKGLRRGLLYRGSSIEGTLPLRRLHESVGDFIGKAQIPCAE